MKFLIILIVSSFILLFGGLFLRGERYSFWMKFINSSYVRKSDFLIERFLVFFQKEFKKSLLVLRGFLKTFLLSFLSFLFVINKIIYLLMKEINKFFFRVYRKYHKQKPIKKQVSEYLKKMEEYKEDIVNEQDRRDF